MQETTEASLIRAQTGTSIDRRVRSIPGRDTYTVIAYPSLGGVVIGRLMGTELEWIGLPRAARCTEYDIKSDQHANGLSEEDKLAFRLMQLGARWWPSYDFWAQHNDLQYPYGHHYPPELHVGYPDRQTKRILVLQTFANNSPMRLREYDAPEKPGDWSRLLACRTMDERCAVLRDFRAMEWDDVDKCPYLPSSLGQGVAEGERYKKLLNSMKDTKYLDDWLMSL